MADIKLVSTVAAPTCGGKTARAEYQAPSVLITNTAKIKVRKQN